MYATKLFFSLAWRVILFTPFRQLSLKSSNFPLSYGQKKPKIGVFGYFKLEDINFWIFRQQKWIPCITILVRCKKNWLHHLKVDIRPQKPWNSRYFRLQRPENFFFWFFNSGYGFSMMICISQMKKNIGSPWKEWPLDPSKF